MVYMFWFWFRFCFHFSLTELQKNRKNPLYWNLYFNGWTDLT